MNALGQLLQRHHTFRKPNAVVSVNKRALLLGILATFMVTAANATVYFDSVNVPGKNLGSDGYSDGSTLTGQSFTAAALDFNSITLTLSASNPSDGGAALVYLIADNGRGGATGIAGDPTYVPYGTDGSEFTNFTNAVLIGSVADSSLGTSLSETAPFSIGSSAVAAVAAATQNQEYWIVIDTNGSSVGWAYNDGNPAGAGTDGQAYWNNIGSYGPSAPVTNGGGAYQMIIQQVPEPATIALLGFGLAGLGCIRRRARARF